MALHSSVGCRTIRMFLLMAATAGQATADRLVQQLTDNLKDVPTVTSYNGQFDFDVFIIGAGSGGIRLAKTLSRQKQLKVGIAESHDFGGTCVNRGCNPKKTLVVASAFHTDMEQAKANGIWNVNAEMDWTKLQDWRAQKVSSVAQFYNASLGSASNIAVFEQAASVMGEHEVKIGSDISKTAGLLVLATGGKPRRMTFPGSDLPNVITSDEALELKQKPRSMLVVGAGYIAVELASFFLQMGADVTMAMRSHSSLLKSFDSDVRGLVEDSLRKRGLKIEAGKQPAKIVQLQQSNLLSVEMTDGQKLEVEYVLMAIGREPLTAHLGLEAVGIELDMSHKVPVNRYGQTSAPWIFAIGDIVANGMELQPVAVKQADLLAEVILRDPSAATAAIVQPPVPDEHVATALFATPRAGSVGLTEEAANAKFSGDVTVLVEKTEPCCSPIFSWGLLKVVYRTSDERLLGIHIAGKGADELVQAFGILMALNPTWTQVKSALAVHPTATEYIIFMNSYKSKRKGNWRLSDCPTPDPCPG